MRIPLVSRYRMIGSYTSANWPRFWRGRLDLPILFCVLGICAAVVVDRIYAAVFVVRQNDPVWNSYRDLPSLACMLLIIAAAAYWLYSLSRGVRMSRASRFNNFPWYSLILLGLALIFGGYLLTGLELDALGPLREDLKNMGLPLAIFVALIALAFKIANLYSSRVLFIGLAWWIVSVGVTLALMAVVVSVYAVTAGQKSFWPWDFKPDWLGAVLTMASALPGLILMHWPVLRSVIAGNRRRFVQYAVVSLTFGSPLLAIPVVIFALDGVRTLANYQIESPLLWSSVVIMSIVLIEITLWIAARIETYPET